MSAFPGIALALDLARMPALAHSTEKRPLPKEILEIMRVAAGSPETCQLASQATGQPPAVLVEAARFYLQQMLLRPDADSYRVLGLTPGASRELARQHLRSLLQWLHPDVNSEWDSVYAERVLKAWREVSAKIDSSAASNSRLRVLAEPGTRAQVHSALSARIPWIQRPQQKAKTRPTHVSIPAANRVGIGLATVALLVAVVIVVFATHSG
jgi:DnaJ-domain-containing protein 1